MSTLSVKQFSNNLFRASRLTPEGASVSNTLLPLSGAQAETPAEKTFISRTNSNNTRTKAVSYADDYATGNRLSSPGQNAVDNLVGSLRESSTGLAADLTSSSLADFQPLSEATLSELKHANPIAHDRFVAVPEMNRHHVRASGTPEGITFLIPRPNGTQPISDGLSTSIPNGRLQIEEVFRSERSPQGPTAFSGKRLHNGEWYHFQGQAATPPQSEDRGRAPIASAAVTNFAPERLLASKNPASLTEFYDQRVPTDVRGITEGPWKPFLQGQTLAGSHHQVQGAKSGPNGFEAFTSTFDSVVGTLKNIQSLAKGIQKVADYFEIAGELGQFGDLLGWISALNLPKSPADFINSILLGKGIIPGGAPPTGVSSHAGSGVDGCVVTQCGAYANAYGEGMIAALGVQDSGAGADAAGGEGKNEEIGGSVPENTPPQPENENPEAEKQEQEKQEQEKQDLKNQDTENGQTCAEPTKDDPSFPWDDQSGKEPNQCYDDHVAIESRSLFGVADHSYIVVNKDGERITYSGRNENFPSSGPLGVERNYENDLNHNSDWIYRVPPPEGMSNAEWVDRVAQAGDNAVWNSDTREYSWHGGDGGQTSGNCHIVSGEILEDAAGRPITIPHDQRPPRYSPGLPVDPPPPGPACPPGYPIIVPPGSENCDPRTPQGIPIA